MATTNDMEKKLKSQAEMNIEEIKAMLVEMQSGNNNVITHLLSVKNDIEKMLLFYADAVIKNRDLFRYDTYMRCLLRELNNLKDEIDIAVRNKSISKREIEEIIDISERRIVRALECIRYL